MRLIGNRTIVLGFFWAMPGLALAQKNDRAPDEPAAVSERHASPTTADRGTQAPETADAAAKLQVSGEAAKAVGALINRKVLDALAATTEVRAKLRTRLHFSDFTFTLPLRLSGRQTFGAALRQLDGKAAIRTRWHPRRFFALESDVGFRGAWRPGWKDLYQPIPEMPTDPPVDPSEFHTTDRYSFVTWHLGLAVSTKPWKRQTIEAAYRFFASRYSKDPNYRSVVDVDPEPNHLVPADHLKHEGRLRWRYRGTVWRFAAVAIVWSKKSEFIFARDAETGATHAAPGGRDANPLQSLLGIEPHAQLGVRLRARRLRLDLRLSAKVIIDRFEGYYSYVGPESRFTASYAFDIGVRLKAVIAWRWRHYGPNSYAETPGDIEKKPHPALEFGDRRVDSRFAADLVVSYQLDDRWRLFVEADLVWRRTNFPDYRPGEFPRSRNYAIDWSYVNGSAVAGIAMSF